MRTGILITPNGQAHSPEQWALATASMLTDPIEVADSVPGARQFELEQLKLSVKSKIAMVMVDHHRKCQNGERGKLSAGDHDRMTQMNHDLHMAVAEHTDVEAAVKDVLAAFEPLKALAEEPIIKAGSVGRMAESLTVDEWLEAMVRGVVQRDLNSVVDIERSSHHDRNPMLPECKLWAHRRHASGHPNPVMPE